MLIRVPLFVLFDALCGILFDFKVTMDVLCDACGIFFSSDLELETHCIDVHFLSDDHVEAGNSTSSHSM